MEIISESKTSEVTFSQRKASTLVCWEVFSLLVVSKEISLLDFSLAIPDY